MKTSLWIVSGFLAGTAFVWAADAQHGAAVLRAERCLDCHNILGEGPSESRTAPDLGQRLVSAYTVPALAAELWDHTPSMLAQMPSRAITQPIPSEADWDDVFVYLYSLQFFDRRASALRGARLFESKHCAECHSMKNRSPGKAVAAWAPVDDPVMLVSQMWTHASTMKKQIAARKGWSKLSGRDLQDLTLYFQSVQKLLQVPRKTRISLPDPAEGRIMVGLQCGKCHAGSDSLAVLVRNKTLMDIGAAMWNHVPRVQAVPAISPDDMRKVVAYVWELQYRGPAGIASRGEVTFMEKGCISCHRTPTPKQTPQSPRPGKTFTATSMVALGWGSGREMHRQMLEKGITWPQLSPEDISNLVAFMNTLNR